MIGTIDQCNTLRLAISMARFVSAHDAIGRVDIDLSVFLFPNYSPKEISGFFPIFDTMHGLRGELELSVSVNLIPTTNKPTDVLFFASAAGTYHSHLLPISLCQNQL